SFVEHTLRRMGCLLAGAAFAASLTLPAASAHEAQAPLDRSEDGVWQAVPESAFTVAAGERWIVPLVYRTFRVDEGALRAVLSRAPLEEAVVAARKAGAGGAGGAAAGVVMTLPMPNGTSARCSVFDAPMLEDP